MRFHKVTPVMKILRVLASFLLLAVGASGAPNDQKTSLELTRPARPWEFLSAVGTKAGIFGNEAGQVEAWVYPLKIFRDFHLRFHTEGRVLPAESLVRTITARPESTTILYTSDTFAIRETFFVPVNEPGAVILFEVETEFPVEIEAAFHRDFQLEWPAALGATYINWERDREAFYFGEEQKKYAAFVGSPTATEEKHEYQTNYSSGDENSFRLGVTEKGKDAKVILLAASVTGRADAEVSYQRLASGYKELLGASAEYYRNYLSQTVSVSLSDEELERAYDWSRISMVQGVVTNPYLGTGLVAGYRTSGESQRPGFAWFFGRDSMWTALGLDADGDFANTKKALEFVSKYQRDDGKMPHEIAQGASFVNWFTDYPYAYASADATPLYIITMNDYVIQSGDVAFAQAKWESIWKAYQFLRSTYDAQGLPQNVGIGHGWVEGGPLLPVKTELYQSGLGAEALRALSNLARLTGKDKESKELAQDFERQKTLVNKAFWIADKKRFAFALDKDDKIVDEASVLATVPMWFGVLDEDRAGEMIGQLADSNHQTDWGMRIISGEAAKFSGGGYHYGSVWPLFTGWASVGEYRYHREHAAYANLRANALLALDGSPGHVTEVLSGDYYQPLSTSSPHQIWSAAMVVSPVLRGMLGLQVDAERNTIKLVPHVPADWYSFVVENIHVSGNVTGFSYVKSADGILLRTKLHKEGTVVEFEPAISLRAKVISVELNGRSVPFHVVTNAVDQHVITRFTSGSNASTLRIRLRDEFGVTYHSELPQLGSTSEGLRILGETWSASRDQLTLSVSGMAGHPYELSVWNASQVTSVDGAEFVREGEVPGRLRVLLPETSGGGVVRWTIVIHLTGKSGRDRAPKQ